MLDIVVIENLTWGFRYEFESFCSGFSDKIISTTGIKINNWNKHLIKANKGQKKKMVDKGVVADLYDSKYRSVLYLKEDNFCWNISSE